MMTGLIILATIVILVIVSMFAIAQIGPIQASLSAQKTGFAFIAGGSTALFVALLFLYTKLYKMILTFMAGTLAVISFAGMALVSNKEATLAALQDWKEYEMREAQSHFAALETSPTPVIPMSVIPEWQYGPQPIGSHMMALTKLSSKTEKANGDVTVFLGSLEAKLTKGQSFFLSTKKSTTSLPWQMGKGPIVILDAGVTFNAVFCDYLESGNMTFTFFEGASENAGP